jgi:methionyl-tRNA formyltransferase
MHQYKYIVVARWRGAAIQRAILAGDDRTGISIMRMEEGLDTGPVYLQREIPITPQDTGGTVHDKLAALGARSIVDTLPQIAASRLAPLPQSRDGVSYAQKIAKDEAKVDWGREAFDVERRVRAFDPLPGAYSLLGGETVKIWKAHADARGGGDPGAILNADAAGLAVSCGRGTLTITQLQRSGGKRLSAADFLRGLVLAPGSRFGG